MGTRVASYYQTSTVVQLVTKFDNFKLKIVGETRMTRAGEEISIRTRNTLCYTRRPAHGESCPNY